MQLNFRRGKRAAWVAALAGHVLVLCMGLAGCGGGGTSPSAPVSGLPTATFSASVASVSAGQPVTLTWSTTSATGTQISGVSGAPASPIVVYPSATTTYTLTASNSVGSVMKTVTVTVTAASSIATFTVATPAGQLVPANYMGLGVGESTFESVFGEPATGANPVLRQIVRNITQYGASPITYKVTAYEQYPLSAATYVPTAAEVSALSQLYTDLGVTFFIGVNLAADNVGVAVNQAQAYASLMPVGSVIGFEIGNEPDNYTHSSEAYRTAPYYFLTDYASFEPSVLSTLRTYQPNAKLIGPVWGQPATVTGGSSNIVNNSGTAIDLSNS